MNIKVVGQQVLNVGDQEKSVVISLLERTGSQITPRVWELIERRGLDDATPNSQRGLKVVCLVPELKTTLEYAENILFQNFLKFVHRLYGLVPCPFEVGIRLFLEKAGLLLSDSNERIVLDDYTVVVLEDPTHGQHLAIEPCKGRHYLDVHSVHEEYHVKDRRPMLFVKEQVA
ncbi:MAG: hypothetical protein UV64_C0005G0006 [Parcubacteria group bacterium GW2011_GWC1_43_11b]|uniref:Uncharacterized protein n=2 Tax=Candidatus Vogeliibacteriota TaxID=1817922 RepID=A0A1G2QG25_9BACT|nr:MAG: hypothetical protein UV50_C0018G0007 [Parcubacteria group bacterium GW2011_GWB1_42_9]KKS89487.1 MAG: hypothetical protein UV64_C0005G0006 [Parcubacteria group bacterium GW2011_GWC1_43_11b]KKT10158.1 MAG: hypothetical protein UV88_C0001G0054 [Parcubacteria group bacterium GW2011_GWA1_43_21]OHA59009.1 MAG: hypothetical protein A2370_00615 [Candidatus Vogelbacteria bacterium RIFOXYB1_FULL_42_16]OHA60341.1 MAG: hypothetical protein A2607_01965 [Candidatus Vogelbacteria bacterium RIFOXYD1_FU